MRFKVYSLGEGCTYAVLALFVAFGRMYDRAPAQVLGGLVMQARYLSLILVGFAVVVDACARRLGVAGGDAGGQRRGLRARGRAASATSSACGARAGCGAATGCSTAAARAPGARKVPRRVLELSRDDLARGCLCIPAQAG